MTQEIIEFYKNVRNIKEQLRLYRSRKFRIPNVEAVNRAEAKRQLAIIVGQIDARLKSLTSSSQQERDEVKDIRIFLKQLEKTMNNPDEKKKINCVKEAKKVIGTYSWGQVVLKALLILSGLIGNVASLVASLFGVSLVKNNKQSESTEKLMSLLSKKNKIRPVKVDRPQKSLSVDPWYQDSKDDREQSKNPKDPLIEKRKTLEVNPDVPIEQASRKITITYIDKTKKNGISKATLLLPVGENLINSSIFDEYRSTLISVVIPDSVTSIEREAFRGCCCLVSVDIPASVTSIGEDAFGSCLSLTSVEIPAGVPTIANSAFWGCRSLTSILIPASVTSIDKYAFNCCSSLTSIVIPANVTYIAPDAFFNCDNLTSITINAKNEKDYQRILNMLPPYLQERAKKTVVMNKALSIVKTSILGQGFFSKNELPIEIAAMIASRTVALNFPETLLKDEKATKNLETGIYNLIQRKK